MESVEANIDFKLIGQRIKDARAKKGYSQQKLAEQIDVAVAYLSRIERAGTPINLNRLGQISLILDVPLEELVTGIVVESENYLDKELHDLLKECSKEKQKLIYNIAKIVAGVSFV